MKTNNENPIQPMEDQPAKPVYIEKQENHNCQQFYGPVTGCVFAMPGATVNQYPGATHAHGKAPVTEEVDEALAEKLVPVFFGNRELVAEFMGRIKGAKPTDVTAEVNRLLKERKVSDISCNKALWEILHENGFYAPTLSNWNSQIR